MNPNSTVKTKQRDRVREREISQRSWRLGLIQSGLFKTGVEKVGRKLH